MIAQIGDYKLLKRVGKGSFGEVFLAEDSDGDKFAAKLLPMSTVGDLMNHFQESIIQGVAEHPNLLRAIDFEVTENYFMLIMKWCQQGSLMNHIEKMPGLGATAQRFMLEIASGLEHLHTKMGVVHRDLKGDNILFDDNHALISDYGLARFINPEDYI